MTKAAEKPVMLGTRISPKLQYGLRLLAKLQGRTIADAVEWAISLALRQTRVGDGDERLNRLIDQAWAMDSEPQRIYYLHSRATELLEFDERAAWSLVRRCEDLWEEFFYSLEDGAPVRVPKDHEGREPEFDEKRPIWPLIEKNWEPIKYVGIALAHAGEIEMRFSLSEILSGKALERAGIT